MGAGAPLPRQLSVPWVRGEEWAGSLEDFEEAWAAEVARRHDPLEFIIILGLQARRHRTCLMACMVGRHLCHSCRKHTGLRHVCFSCLHPLAVQQRSACGCALSSGAARSSVLEAEAGSAAAASAGTPAEQPPTAGTAHPDPSRDNFLPGRHVSDPGSAASSRAGAAKGLGPGTASSEPDGRTGPAKGLGLAASPAGSAAGGSSARPSDDMEAGAGGTGSDPDQNPGTADEAAAAAAAAAAAHAEAARVAAERDARARWQAMQEEEADLLVRMALFAGCRVRVSAPIIAAIMESRMAQWQIVHEEAAGI